MIISRIHCLNGSAEADGSCGLALSALVILPFYWESAGQPPQLSPSSGDCLAKPNTSFRVSYVEICLLQKCVLDSYC